MSKVKGQIIIIVIILIIGSGALFYWDFKETQESVVKVESKLAEDGFEKFYQKQGNKFCIKEKEEKEQEAIVQDMLWVLDSSDYKRTKRVECEDGEIGIEIE